MAYFGKEFKFAKEENFEAFITALGVAEEKAKKYLEYRPNQKVVKDGDGYRFVLNTPEGSKEIGFKNGVTFDEEVRDGLKAKTTVSVDGDTFTQVQDFGPKGTVTFKREYAADSLKVTATASIWNGAAYRYYVPA